jgi:hypothetical protein
MPDAPAPAAARRISAEEGRALLTRVKRFQLLERLSGLAMLLSIPVFALSYFQLRAIDEAAKGGGVRAIPWLAWVAVAVFIAGFGLMRLAKTMIGRDHRVLTAEDHERKMESLDAEFENGNGTDGKGRQE